MSSTIAKQGIISILGSDCDQITKSASLRRTLSADMSSKHWLAQNGFPLSSMKRIASSEELANKKSGTSFSSYEQDEETGQDEVWRLIQSQKKEVVKHGQDDIWASIVSQKANEEENSTLPPPYVHPLVKRSTSALSEKSLEICTESLGSETGSDVFSSCAPSETGESEEDKDVTQVTQPQPQPQQEKEWQPFSLEKSHFAKYSTTKISAPKSFPPPLPSLAQRDGPSLHMQPRRGDGRLVLEAVSIPSHNCFCAQRQDGRLLLTLANNTVAQELDLEEVVDEEEEIDELEEDVFNNFERKDSDYVTEEEEEEEESGEEDENEDRAIGKFQIVSGTKEFGFVMNQTPNYSKEVISVHRSALMMKRLVGLNNNRDPKWTEKLKKATNLVGMEAYLNPTAPLSQSLTGPLMGARLIQSSPVTGTAASFNACDYFWRTKPSMESTISPIAQNTSSLKMNNYYSPKLNQNQEMVLMKGNKGEDLVPLVSGCKENKKSLLFWESYCIATS